MIGWPHAKEEVMAEQTVEVLGTFYGDESFPIEWNEGERELFWIFDDLHIPNPVSPMFFDIGGWWLTCDHMFRRFGTAFACDWIAKEINGYVYTAAIPATGGLEAEASEYGARYAARVPLEEDYAEKIGPYLGFVLPHYARNFLDWWRVRLRPEIERNFAYLDAETDATDAKGLDELAVLLEDAIDVHDRHWKIHWMINFSQFSAVLALDTAIREAKGRVDPELMGRLQNSIDDRNWDTIEALWSMKEEIKGDDELRAAFESETAADILRALDASKRGRRFIDASVVSYQKEFGYKAIWSHEFAFRLWREDPAPIVEQLRGYLATDYDYHATINAVRDDLDAAVAELLDGVPDGETRARLEAALEMSLKMNPLTPDHHFYVDQGTNARLRLVLIAIGRKLVERGDLWDPEDVVYLRYQELRQLIANPDALDAKTLVGERRDRREEASRIRPRDWVGTATEEALAFPYAGHWGFPEKFNRPPPEKAGEVHGLAASPGVVEGPARLVESVDEFDEVQAGDILVCKMTNPAWVVVFTKIAGLVSDAGGTVSHPAVVSREFGIPAVVGTSTATATIKTGDRLRVNGSTGVVEILA
jgi:phosphohistidine swiveling domain-containing protein